MTSSYETAEHSHWAGVVGETSVREGDTCPTCSRRMPHEKKDSSPQTKVNSYRVPVDIADTHKEVARAAAEALGVFNKPHWQYALNTYGYALILQGSRLEETGS